MLADELGFRGSAEIQGYQDDVIRGFVYEFRAQVWTHKLPPVNKTEKVSLTIPTWNSAWQLWKANHADSKLFGWIARRWPPQKRGSETHTGTVSFDIDRKVIFPESNYPANLGTPYMQTVLTDPEVQWYP